MGSGWISWRGWLHRREIKGGPGAKHALFKIGLAEIYRSSQTTNKALRKLLEFNHRTMAQQTTCGVDRFDLAPEGARKRGSVMKYAAKGTYLLAVKVLGGDL